MKNFGPLALTLLAAAVLAIIGTTPPSPNLSDGSDGKFSTARAMQDVRIIASAPHPTGSAENAKVRTYIQRELEAIGAEVSLVEGAVPERSLTRFGKWSGTRPDALTLTNIIGVLPGRDRGKPAVALMSHHDTVFGSPGAPDDTAGVASILETARIIAAKGPTERDIIIVLTDGEELGLLGAKQFVSTNPLSDRIGAIINLEARGGGGRTTLFQTSANNDAVVQFYAHAVPRPGGSSLATFIYENLPNDTDLTPALERDYAAYNLSFIGRPGLYHSPKATPERLDQGSVQDMGAQTLALTRALANAETLPRASAKTDREATDAAANAEAPSAAATGGEADETTSGAATGGEADEATSGAATGGEADETTSGAATGGEVDEASGSTSGAKAAADQTGGTMANRTFFDVFGLFLIHYGTIAGWVLLGLTAALNILCLRANTIGKWWQGLLASGAVILGGGCALYLVNLLSGAGSGEGIYYDRLAAIPLLEVQALLICAATLAISAPLWAGRGGTILGLLIALVMQITAPTTSFLLVWPLLLGGIAGVSAVYLQNKAGLALRISASALAIGMLLQFGHQFMQGVGPDMPSIVALLAALALPSLGVLLPSVRRKPTMIIAGICLLASLAVALTVRFDPVADTVPVYNSMKG